MGINIIVLTTLSIALFEMKGLVVSCHEHLSNFYYLLFCWKDFHGQGVPSEGL